jgi:hypothetical protein
VHIGWEFGDVAQGWGLESAPVLVGGNVRGAFLETKGKFKLELVAMSSVGESGEGKPEYRVP